ncbi:DUF5959 family protein [Streptomyces sp. PKU-MA01144]|uniref:DUF5959 family protein n=1 Tax=Streptomyces sp. PKU-MA01144 TaxID=2729138 RepID=UPI0028121ACC|nr:DUF5959 family protein [Streptomyces sp. PKU-MA01144]
MHTDRSPLGIIPEGASSYRTATKYSNRVSPGGTRDRERRAGGTHPPGRRCAERRRPSALPGGGLLRRGDRHRERLRQRHRPDGFDADDIRAWGSLLDAVEEDEYDEEDDSVFAGDWPQEGRTAYLTFAADDPYVVEVRDAPSTQICVRVPLDLGGDWITEARERHAAARQALGV